MNDESRTKQELIEELQELRVLLAKPEGGAPVHQGDGAAFQVLLEGAAGKTGESFFAAVVNALAAWLHVDCVILGTLNDHETLQAYTMFLDGRAVDGFSYPLAGSPCEKATHTGYCVFPEGVTAQFPDDRDLQELGAEGYVGIPLRDKQHHLIGILCAISRTRLTLPAKSREVFEIIAARAASELERKAAEEALQSSEERYREVVELSTEAIISCLDGKTSLWNRAAEQLFGYTSEEALGRDVAFIIPEQQREAHKAAWEKVRDTGVLKYGGKVILLEGLRKDGVIFPIEISFSARQDSGKLCCTVIIRDITHRRRTEEALRNLAKVFSESVTPTVIEDMNGIICDANDAAVAVYGWSRDELIGSPIKKLVPADLQEEQGSALHERCRSGALVRDVEGVRIHKDGTPIPVLLTLSLLTDDKNNPTGIVTHATDITYRKKAEEARELLHSQLLQAQKVEAIGTLAGGVAHDFNNLLTAIMGNADLALMNINKEESLSRNLANIKDAGTRAAALTRQLLLYSRKQSLMITTFNINDVVQNILEMLRRLIGEDIAID
ncbi:MAG: PAS domain S-box protein, partial [Thermodesulfobacteriota bacterium]